MLASWLVLPFALVALVSIRIVVVPLEEAQLLSRFGEEYRAYSEHSGCLVPRLTARRRDSSRAS